MKSLYILIFLSIHRFSFYFKELFTNSFKTAVYLKKKKKKKKKKP